MGIGSVGKKDDDRNLILIGERREERLKFRGEDSSLRGQGR
jgi:hypothetical protein